MENTGSVRSSSSYWPTLPQAAVLATFIGVAALSYRKLNDRRVAAVCISAAALLSAAVLWALKSKPAEENPLAAFDETRVMTLFPSGASIESDEISDEIQEMLNKTEQELGQAPICSKSRGPSYTIHLLSADSVHLVAQGKHCCLVGYAKPTARKPFRLPIKLKLSNCQSTWKRGMLRLAPFAS